MADPQIEPIMFPVVSRAAEGDPVVKEILRCASGIILNGRLQTYLLMAAIALSSLAGAGRGGSSEPMSGMHSIVRVCRVRCQGPLGVDLSGSDPSQWVGSCRPAHLAERARCAKSGSRRTVQGGKQVRSSVQSGAGEKVKKTCIV